MKKTYSLDYTIESDVDRLAAINEILANIEYKPSSSDLEQMATYIMYGKDADGKNAIQRGEITDENRRYAKTYRRASEKVLSLDALMESPAFDESAPKTLGERYIYTKPHPTIDREKDADIPGMADLWTSIDRMAHIIAVNEGREPYVEGDPIIDSSYHLYQLRHWLIDLRRHQYYLKDAFRPTLHFQNIQHSSTPPICFDSDACYWAPADEIRSAHPEVDVTTLPCRENGDVLYTVRHQAFDWENPTHIRALVENYSAVYMQNWDKPDSWGRTLIYDFDRYTTMAHLSPLREYILTRRIDKAGYRDIIEELKEKFGITYNESYICTIAANEIPTAIAKAAYLHRLEVETPKYKCKKCKVCGRLLPRLPEFFPNNPECIALLDNTCKACQQKQKGPNYDKRYKAVRKVPPTQTDSSI